jgi:hypothetical protein
MHLQAKAVILICFAVALGGGDDWEQPVLKIRGAGNHASSRPSGGPNSSESSLRRLRLQRDRNLTRRPRIDQLDRLDARCLAPVCEEKQAGLG